MKRLIIIFLIILSLGCNGRPNVYYVAPKGGSDMYLGKDIAHPWATFQHAIDMAFPGDTVYFRGGIYYMNSGILYNPYEIPRPHGRSGTPDNPICFLNYPGETPIFDFINCNPKGNFNTGMLKMFVDFVKMKGMIFRNLRQFRYPVEVVVLSDYACSNLEYENITIHDCSGAGFRFLGGFGSKGGNPAWYRYDYDTVRYLNCDAYNLCDSINIGSSTGGRADGFKTDNNPGAYFLFFGCRVWNCSDDGYDSSGSALRDYFNCWAFNIGHLDGDGYGWKNTGPRDDVTTLTLQIVNCLSAYNRQWGFAQQDQYSYYYNVANYFNNTAYHNLWN
jgi:hypothetical protein